LDVNDRPIHNANLVKFYELIDVLENGLHGRRTFKSLRDENGLLNKGVYFIFEDNEIRFNNPSKLRVTRVGTLGIQDSEERNERTLWDRLNDHKGYQSGGGSCRHSVLRRHVGHAIISKSQGSIVAPAWCRKKPPWSEEERVEVKAVEPHVTRYIGEMSFLWVVINDEPSNRSDRKFVEKYAIALLSKHREASENWLGNFARNDNVKNSGLWNDDDVGGRLHADFLNILEYYVELTINEKYDSEESIAPYGWWEGQGEDN
jgi:hypothetical protein